VISALLTALLILELFYAFQPHQWLLAKLMMPTAVNLALSRQTSYAWPGAAKGRLVFCLLIGVCRRFWAFFTVLTVLTVIAVVG